MYALNVCIECMHRVYASNVCIERIYRVYVSSVRGVGMTCGYDMDELWMTWNMTWMTWQ
jgi:hypothetical protein